MPGSSRKVPSEKRRSARKTVLRQGVVDFGEGRGEHNCLILDISDLGARLSLDYPSAAPEKVALKVSGGASYDCRVVWQHDGSMGVEFVEAHSRQRRPDDEPRRDPRMAVLRRGRIIFNGGYCTMDCHILDLSAGGARIRPIDPVTCPEVFKLSVEFGPSRACRIVRRDGEDLGVEFLDRKAGK